MIRCWKAVLQYEQRTERNDKALCNTANGAMCSAALYSIIATAQANGIDAEQYLTELFSHPAGTIILPLNT